MVSFVLSTDNHPLVVGAEDGAFVGWVTVVTPPLFVVVVVFLFVVLPVFVEVFVFLLLVVFPVFVKEFPPFEFEDVALHFAYNSIVVSIPNLAGDTLVILSPVNDLLVYQPSNLYPVADGT